MTDTVTDEQAEVGTPDAGRRTTIVLLAVMAVALLAAALAGGYFWGSRSGSTAPAKPSAVDVGFARDMSAHHQQAIEMAAYARDNSANPAVVHLAYDIETNQSLEVGEMTGWLDTWGLTRYSAHPMTWMGGHHHVGANGLMPGMATSAQISTLMAAKGKALDILFLQLMIHHHQGGAPMARYAAQHASADYVRTLAGHMLANQTTETLQMERLLRQLGGAPLPAPTD
jgi:uncharacterized protein (DUF305 family)